MTEWGLNQPQPLSLMPLLCLWQCAQARADSPITYAYTIFIRLEILPYIRTKAKLSSPSSCKIRFALTVFTLRFYDV